MGWLGSASAPNRTSDSPRASKRPFVLASADGDGGHGGVGGNDDGLAITVTAATVVAAATTVTAVTAVVARYRRRLTNGAGEAFAEG